MFTKLCKFFSDWYKRMDTIATHHVADETFRILSSAHDMNARTELVSELRKCRLAAIEDARVHREMAAMTPVTTWENEYLSKAAYYDRIAELYAKRIEELT